MKCSEERDRSERAEALSALTGLGILTSLKQFLTFHALILISNSTLQKNPYAEFLL
jgi:hypothetical protein